MTCMDIGCKEEDAVLCLKILGVIELLFVFGYLTYTTGSVSVLVSGIITVSIFVYFCIGAVERDIVLLWSFANVVYLIMRSIYSNDVYVSILFAVCLFIVGLFSYTYRNLLYNLCIVIAIFLISIPIIMMFTVMKYYRGFASFYERRKEKIIEKVDDLEIF